MPFDAGTLLETTSEWQNKPYNQDLGSTFTAAG
jgi:hypothetical protein